MLPHIPVSFLFLKAIDVARRALRARDTARSIAIIYLHHQKGARERMFIYLRCSVKARQQNNEHDVYQIAFRPESRISNGEPADFDD